MRSKNKAKYNSKSELFVGFMSMSFILSIVIGMFFGYALADNNIQLVDYPTLRFVISVISMFFFGALFGAITAVMIYCIDSMVEKKNAK